MSNKMLAEMYMERVLSIFLFTESMISGRKIQFIEKIIEYKWKVIK